MGATTRSPSRKERISRDMEYDRLWARLKATLDSYQVAGVTSIHPAIIRDKMDDLLDLADKDDQIENQAIQFANRTKVVS